MKRTLAALASMAGALGLAGIAHATVYDLNVDSCSGGCGLSDYGTVTVTGEGTGTLNISIALSPSSVFFNQAGNALDAVAFSLVGGPGITISGLPSTFVANGAQAAGSNHEDGLGFWDYIVDWVGPPTSNSPLTTHNLSFTVTGPTPLTLGFNPINGKNVFFSVDIANKVSADVINTGVVGATLAAVPEPATWAMMLFGVGAIGATMRASRRKAAAPATA